MILTAERRGSGEGAVNGDALLREPVFSVTMTSGAQWTIGAGDMILFVGLIPFEHRDRESFQEFDPHAWFGTGAKRVMVLDHPERASEIVAEAAAKPPVAPGAPVSVAGEPLFADIIARSQRLKAQIDGWAASGAANAPGFFAAEPYTVFKGEAERLAAAENSQ